MQIWFLRTTGFVGSSAVFSSFFLNLRPCLRWQNIWNRGAGRLFFSPWPGHLHDLVHHSLLSCVVVFCVCRRYDWDVVGSGEWYFSSLVVEVSSFTQGRRVILLGLTTSSLGLFSVYVVFSCVLFLAPRSAKHPRCFSVFFMTSVSWAIVLVAC